jgi:hypothetical protein|nr:MAG TPA: hypothetical protein [Caudoviricetes sp.]
MKLSELMKDVTPNAQYTGWTTNDDFVLAIDLTPGAAQATEESAYGVVQMGVAGLDAQMNPVTQDKQYIRAGQSTQKTGTQRSFTISGDRYVGDEVQDYIFSHDIKYGTGNTVVTNYVYFNILTGKGEKGTCSIIVNSDGGGNAGESAGIDVEFKKIGSTPTEYTYSAT